MRKKTKIIIGASSLLLLAAAGTIALGGKSPAAALHLETAQATRTAFVNSVTATGTVEPVVTVEVGTQVSGIIDKIHVDYNSVVARGQLLAEMDKVNLEAELRAGEADLESSLTEFEYQQKNYARSQMLHEKQLISDSEYETAAYNYLRSKSSYERTVSTMTRVRRNLEYATITSPIDGVVINRAVEEGQTVAAGFSTPTLFTIAGDLTQMRVIAAVDEADIGQVDEGQNVRFTVDAYPNDVFEGRVTQVRLEAIVASNVVTYEVVISAYNPDLKLKPGLTASVTIHTLERPDAIAIPTKSLRFIPEASLLATMKLAAPDADVQAPPGKRIVWQRTGDTLQPRFITTGESSMNMTEVTEGLDEGEEIIVELSSPAAAPAAQANTLMMGPRPPGQRR